MPPRPGSAALAIGVLAWGLALGAGPAAAQDLPRLAAEVAGHQGRVIIGLRPAPGLRGMRAPGIRGLDRVAQAAIAADLRALGVRASREFEIITALAGTVDTALLARLLAHPNVEYVVPDHEIELTRGERRDGGSVARAVETIPYGVSLIRAPEAWALTTPGSFGEGVKVAILDSGGDFDHEDLVFAGGFDVTTGSADPAAWNDDVAACGGHGTHVSGTLGARRGNDVGVVGVAPSAELYMVKVVHAGTSNGSPACLINVSDIIAGLEWARGRVQVVSMSLSGPHNPAERDAIAATAATGIVLVAAAGNNADDVGFPAAYPEVIAVGATDAADARASFSNFGPELEVSAPGVSVPSTLPDDGYGNLSGTSMSTPHVAGLVALILARDPTTSPARVRELLRDGAVDRGEPGWDRFLGEGRVDALATVGLLLAPPGAPAQLAITRQPGGAVSGGAFAVQPVVRLRDATNQPVGQAGVVVTASIASGPGSLASTPPVEVDPTGRKRVLASQAGGTTAVTDAGGVATFTDLTITGAGDHSLSFTVAGLPAASSAVFTVAAGTVTPLLNGVAVPGLSGTAGTAAYYVLSVPAGQTHLDASIAGSVGDADLYLRRGQLPTLNAFDCRPFLAVSTETCAVAAPAAGDWYVMLRAFSSFSGVTLTATTDLGAQRSLAVARQPGGAVSGSALGVQPTVQLRDAAGAPLAQAGVVVSVELGTGTGNLVAGGPSATTDGTGLATFAGLTILGEGEHALRFTAPGMLPVASERFGVATPSPTVLANGTPLTGLAGAAGSGAYYRIGVPAGTGQLEVKITQEAGGSGNADLLVRRGAPPSFADHDCRSFLPGNTDTCTLSNPVPGDWEVVLYGAAAYAGVTLTASYQGPVSAPLTLNGSGQGTGRVTSQVGLQPPLDCAITAGATSPNGCTALYPVGTAVTLTASADSASAFGGWSGAGPVCTVQPSCTVTVDQARTVTASFAVTHRLSVTGQGAGSGVVITQAGVAPSIQCAVVAGVAEPIGCSARYVAGTPVTLAAQPATGSLFVRWVGTGCPATPACTVTLGAAVGLVVEFVPAPTPELAAAEVLGGSGLSAEQRTALDVAGNRNGRVDVGDYLALLERLGLSPSPETVARMLRPAPDRRR